MADDSGYHFTDQSAQVYRGEEARQRLQQVNDAAFLSENAGIVQIPKERWEVAQRFERAGWMEHWVGAADDRNYDHMSAFDGFAALRGRKFDSAIELGCGPFTNSRLIATVCRISEITLLDPLIESYLTLPKVAYDRSKLRTPGALLRWGTRGRGLVHGLVRRLSRIAPALFQGTIPIKELLPTAIETMPPRPSAFDLVILINVIEHCFDLAKIFDRILEISRPGAVLIFHDHLYDHQTVAAMVQGHHYEAGHPLMADKEIIKAFLRDNFECLFERYASEPLDHPLMKEHQTLYYIGKRKGS